MKNDYEYNNRLFEYQREIESLKQKVSELQSTNRNLQLKILEQQKNRNYFLQVENNNKILTEDQKKKINRIKDLEDEILKVTENSKEENRNLQKNLEAEILYYKGLNETGLSKIYAADKVIKLNETQHNFILKLEEKIDEIRDENKVKMNQLQIEHERHYLKLKKQMMDFIKKAQDDMSKNNADNLELNTKFGILYKNQMLNELENQSLQIMDLLKLKEKQQKMIYVLQQEVATHKQVEEIITKKKDEYLKLVQKSTEKNLSKKNSIDKNSIPLLKINNNNCLTDRNIYNHRSFRMMNKKDYNDYKSLEKLYKELLEENHFIKNRYNTLKDKEKMFQEKYKGIINLFNEALEELLKDDEIKNRENIYININEINKGNFEKFTKEEKYYLLVALINNILPLIHISENEKMLSNLKNKINSAEFKMNKTQMTKFSDTSRRQTLQKPFFGISSTNFYNMSTNEESNLISNDRQQFVSIFGDDYIQYGKSIFSEPKSIKKEKEFQKFWKTKTKRSSDNRQNDKKRNFGIFLKSNTYVGTNNNNEEIESFRKKLENISEKKEGKKIQIFKRGNSLDKKLVRVMVINKN